jgi:transglutaminase-like putative cysteine protease
LKIKYFYPVIIIILMITSTSCASINTISRFFSSSRSSSRITSSSSAISQLVSSPSSEVIASSETSSVSSSVSSAVSSVVSSAVQPTAPSSKKPVVNKPSKTPSASTQAAAPTPAAPPAKAADWPASGAVPSPVNVPNLDGTTVESNDRAKIDLSYTAYGFVKVNLIAPSQHRIKVIIIHNGVQYTYDLKNDGSSETFPFQTGNGEYTISVYENIADSQYSQIAAATAQVALNQSTAPFLVPSQFVNYNSSSNAAAIARQQVSGKTNNYERISAVLTYVAQNISYDSNQAANVQSGYIPNVDQVLARRKGICFDYAAVSAAMLRSLGYPTKLVEGYVAPKNIYHAWIEVYINGQGWIKVMSVTVNTSSWSRVDVTFISTSNSPATIEKFVGNGSNYTNKYIF